VAIFGLTGTGYLINDGSGPGIYVTAATTAAAVTGLTARDTYKFSVAAITKKGAGPPSSRSAKLPAAPPGTPVSVSTKLVGTAVVVQRLPPLSNGGDSVTKYVVAEYACPAGLSPCSQTQIGSVTVTSPRLKTTISSLGTGEEYWFTVAASSAAGVGTASAEVTCTVTASKL
jgi:hypothetical protein